MKIERAPTSRCLVGEGPLWDAREGALYFLDITGRKVHRFDPASEQTRSWSTPSSVGALALREGGGAVVALKDGVYALDLDSGALELLARPHDAHPRAQFNDGKVDRRGRFVIGSGDTDFADTQAVGAIHSLAPDRSLARLDGGVHFSNSPCWSPDDKTFYFSDSHLYSVFAYEYDVATGQVAGKRLFADTRDLGGMPDGATVDADGLVWMALFRAGKIVAFRPDGKVERVVETPVRMTVSVTFGGPDLDRLYVTSIDPRFFSEPEEDGGGKVFVIDGLGARGLPEPRYAG